MACNNQLFLINFFVILLNFCLIVVILQAFSSTSMAFDTNDLLDESDQDVDADEEGSDVDENFDENDGKERVIVVDGTADEYFSRDNLYFEVTDPEAISYLYKIKPAKDFGVSLNHTLVDIELVPALPPDSCYQISNTRDIRGNVALVERGECSFLSKALVAELAGAVAVVITDNDPSNDEKLIEMLSDGTSRTLSIPAFFLLGKDGHMIRQILGQLRRSSAIINIPINASLIAELPGQLPPWSIW